METISSWNDRCVESIRKEKAEIEKRYGIRIGQTDIYCARCLRPYGYGGHTCQDIRLKELNGSKKASLKETPELCLKVKKLGAKKVSTMLYQERDGIAIRGVSEEAVRSWIKRGNIPVEYQEAVSAL